MRISIVVVLAVGAALTLAGCVASTELQADAVVEDAEIPEWLHDSLDVPSSELVFLGEEDEMTVYASLDKDGNQCVIAILAPSSTSNGDDGATSTSCTSPLDFASDGARVTVGGGGHSGSAHFLPPGYSEPLEPGWVRVNPQLAVKR
ncbi:hypothetical protein [Salinibacterium sp. M195]|uniref:hypothetical protein n=1 Tax=Salinibacterium sp. M195 TaxID=2583374 RepID=UPI001C634092|nr:hypothetical protein [Salinibacterium sp. M195]QYH34552.1 hypothetical protein FFT87_00470 [Salinibacterium sp. M195]